MYRYTIRFYYLPYMRVKRIVIHDSQNLRIVSALAPEAGSRNLEESVGGSPYEYGSAPPRSPSPHPAQLQFVLWLEEQSGSREP